jgi:hypothetical protein
MHASMDGGLYTRPIPFEVVTEIGSAVELDAAGAELPDAASQRWVRDHIIGHIPGNQHEAE